MSSQPGTIARVSLARSLPRLLLAPVIAALAGIAAIGGGAWIGGWAGVALAIAGASAGVSGILLGVIVFSLRLDVEVTAIHVRWLGGERRYSLARGPVTRVAVRGAGAPRLRVRFGALGWAMGPALLRDSERIEVVRLSPHVPLVLLPTSRGRLAVAPAVERELLDALAAAARVQQRLDAAAAVTRHTEVRPAASVVEPVRPQAPPEAPPVAPGRPAMLMPRPLTGIERAQLEGRLAAERRRRAEEAARRAERELAAREAAERAEAAVTAPVAPGVAPARRRERARWRAPGWLRRPTSGAAVAEASTAASPQIAGALPRERPAVRLPSVATVGFLLLPSAVAGVVWLAVGVWAAPTPGELRQITLALVLAGPAASAAALMSWLVAPRLSGLLVVAGMAALILVGRALLP
jgi:hypothetical protein